MLQRRIATPRETFDDPWKKIVPALFDQFLAFFAPEAAAEIDWERPPEFLDKELRRVAKGLHKRHITADFLVRVWRKDGGEQWVLIHIELQAQKDVTFPERMFLYNVRAFDLYRRPVFGLAVLADSDAAWRPDRFGYQLWGSEAVLRYPMVKLLDYAERQTELEESDNPFVLAVLAHLKTLETRGDAEARLTWKLRLGRILFARKWKRKEIEELLHFLDWIMSLPEKLDDRFDAEWKDLEREQTMAQTMPPIIRRAEARGQQIGKRDTLLRLMQLKYGPLDAGTRAKIDNIADIAQLERLIDAVLTAETLAEMPLPED